MLVPTGNLPGIDASIETIENEFTWGPNGLWTLIGVQLNSASTDSGNTPTTLLRKGLVLGQISATGLWTDYDPAATDGSQEPLAILYDGVNMLDARTGSARVKVAQALILGPVKTGSLYNFDEYARVRLGQRLIYDDYRFPHIVKGPVAKTADYTVLSTDNGTEFTTLGAAGAIVFTLPAVGVAARGYRFKFLNAVDQDMTVTAPAGKLITFNNAAATSVAFSTAGNKIGASVEIIATADGTKYHARPCGANTMTVA